MSKQQFKKYDIVIDHELGLMGYVEKCEWAEIVHSYSYEYKCQYRTDKIENPLQNTIWTKTVVCPKNAAEFVLKKVGRKADEKGEGGESPWPSAGRVQ